MRAICFYFQVHQPFRLRTYRFFDIGVDHHYYDDYANRYILRRVADKCYIPANNTILDLIKEFGTSFKVSYSISGVALDQFEKYTPDVLDSFRQLADTGCVEFLAETYSHSLSAIKSPTEFNSQVKQQAAKIERLFGQKPKTFRNTELIYSDKIGKMVADMGFETMLTEGAKHILGWKSPNYLYCNAINPKLKILLKNYQLSDDIAFRFSQTSWPGWPLTTEKYVDWLNEIPREQECVNLFMDYETFGEHQWPETGIFDFLRALPGRVLSHSDFKFCTPHELSQQLQPVSPVVVTHPISWADEERDLTAWLGNDLQDDAFDKLYELEEKVNRCSDPDILRDWKYLQTSDHFYYMCTKWFSDGDVHKYFNPFNSPYEAFINFMNILSDFIIRVNNDAYIPEGLEIINELKTLISEKISLGNAATEVKFTDEKKTTLQAIKKTAPKKPIKKALTVEKNITGKKTVNKTKTTAKPATVKKKTVSKTKPASVKKKVAAKPLPAKKIATTAAAGKTTTAKPKKIKIPKVRGSEIQLFSNIAPKTIKLIFNDFEIKTLAMALAGADSSIAEKVKSAIGQGRGRRLKTAMGKIITPAVEEIKEARSLVEKQITEYFKNKLRS